VSKDESEQPQGDANSKTLTDLTRAIEELVSGRKKSQELEGTITDAKALLQEWEIKEPSGHRRPLFDDTAPPRTILLAAIVVAQGREIKKLSKGHDLWEQIRRRCPDEFESLVAKVRESDLDRAYAIIRTFPPAKSRPGRAYERKRLRYARGRRSLIEQEFGRVLHPLAEVSPLFSVSPPRCLDGIFQGGRIQMLNLMELFGLDHHRFPKNLRRVKNPSDRRETLYDYRAVVMIMDALLSDERKQRGRTRKVWLSDPSDVDLRSRVLNAIRERINCISPRKQIRSAFLRVIERHLPKSGKK
jgi:hypothetical protein